MALQTGDFQKHDFRKKIYFTLFLLGITLFAHSQNVNEKEKITAHKTDNKINIDGILDEPV